VSPTYISGIVIFLIALLNLLGIKLSQSELTPIIEGIITAVLGINIIWRRYKIGDLTPLGFKKK